MHIDYYASLNSPWTYMGGARIEALAATYNATLRIWPVDFGTIFAGSGGLPLPRRSPQRQAYRLQELARWKAELGLPFNIQPKGFPTSEALSSACVIALRETAGDAPAIRLAQRVLKALWEEEQNPGDEATLAALIGDCGLDAQAVIALGKEPRWAEMRERDTAAALARGVFGAPSYVIGEDIFWGQDRLMFVERRLAKGSGGSLFEA
jgi:carboxymethylenebutenolidase